MSTRTSVTQAGQTGYDWLGAIPKLRVAMIACFYALTQIDGMPAEVSCPTFPT